MPRRCNIRATPGKGDKGQIKLSEYLLLCLLAARPLTFFQNLSFDDHGMRCHVK